MKVLPFRSHLPGKARRSTELQALISHHVEEPPEDALRYATISEEPCVRVQVPGHLHLRGFHPLDAHRAGRQAGPWQQWWRGIANASMGRKSNTHGFGVCVCEERRIAWWQ